MHSRGGGLITLRRRGVASQLTGYFELQLQFFISKSQGCGLGLDVSVSIRSRDVPASRLGLVSRKIVSSRSRPFTSRVQAKALTVS